MDRFTPDTWRDALWRPISMGAPDSGVYIEIMAPDMRFACIAFLTVAIALLAIVYRRKLLSRPTVLLLAFTWLAFIPWLLTSGNGRYFIPVLLLAGPLCIALIHRLPLTAGMRVALAAIIVASQVFAVAQNDPRGSWGLAPWGDYYYDVELTSQDRNQPAAYVLVSSISNSLVAPQFDHRSRWISLSSAPGGPSTVSGQRVQATLQLAIRDGLPLKLLVPTVPDQTTDQLQPTAVVRGEINRLLTPHRLALDPGAQCAMRPSTTMAAFVFGKAKDHDPAAVRRIGFWICPLAFPVDHAAPAGPAAAAGPQANARVDRIFEVLERQCPRLFQPATGSVRIEDGFMRIYADIKAMVMDDGRVYFRYWRALNSNYVGTGDEVLATEFSMDCNQVNGRSGLPWERKL